MDGYCLGCGLVYDVRMNVACPRCQHCPNCGRRHRELPAVCACGHPGDEEMLNKLVRNLDPELKSNQRAIAWLENATQKEQVWRRFRGWRLLVVVLMAFPVVILLSFAVENLLGQRVFNRMCLGLYSLLITFLIFMVRRGRFQWLVEEQQAARPHEQNADSTAQ